MPVEDIWDDLIECECYNCDKKFFLPRWLYEEYIKNDEPITCSAECEYEFETGNDGEAY